MSRSVVAVTTVLLLAGCASRPAKLAVPLPVAVPEVAAPLPKPKPPTSSAANLIIPARLADGSYLTPNRQLSAAATLWHLRSALNVAALACPDASGAISGGYNRLLATHRRSLAEAHKSLSREYGDATAFDVAMTRVYNYFAQPPAQTGFCAAAGAVMAEAVAAHAETLQAFSTDALARLDRPFTDFYAAYDRYRADLAAWHSGRTGPRLAYDMTAIRWTGAAPQRVAAR